MSKVSQANKELQKALGLTDEEAERNGLTGMVRLIVGKLSKTQAAVNILTSQNTELRAELRERVQDEP